MKRFLIFTTRASSLWSWRGADSVVARYEPQTHWSAPEAMAWLVHAIHTHEQARILLMPLASYSAAVAAAVSHLGPITGRDVDFTLLRSARGDTGPLDGAAQTGWASLQMPEVPALIDLGASLDALIAHLDSARVSESADLPAPVEGSLDVKELLAAFGSGSNAAKVAAALPAAAAPGGAAQKEGPDFTKLGLPPKGKLPSLALSSLERKAAELNIPWDQEAYLKWAAESLYAELPHPGWLPLLEEVAPRALNPEDEDAED